MRTGLLHGLRHRIAAAGLKVAVAAVAAANGMRRAAQ